MNLGHVVFSLFMIWTLITKLNLSFKHFSWIQPFYLKNYTHHLLKNMNCSKANGIDYVTFPSGEPGTMNYRVFLKDRHDGQLSFFHSIPLQCSSQPPDVFNMVVEIPRTTHAKLEITKGEKWNPIKQDIKKGALRFIHDVPPFKGYPCNYGALPQTWENPVKKCPHTGYYGDNDPLDVVEISGNLPGETLEPATVGSIKQVKVLGSLALLDEGETDWKVIAIDTNSPFASNLNDVHDIETCAPGLLDSIKYWFRVYKVPDGKPENEFALNGEFQDKKFTLAIIKETHEEWNHLANGTIPFKTDKYEIAL